MAISKIEEIRAKVAAQREQAGTRRVELIAPEKIEAAKSNSPAPVATTVEQSLLYEPEELRTLEGFDSAGFIQKLVKTRQGVEARAPGISNYLQDINKNLVQYPELLHILNDDQIGAITSGILFCTNTSMAELVVKGKIKKALTIAEMEDLF